MKYLACAILACVGAAGAAPASQPPQPQPPLRQALQQYQPGTTTRPAPRELTEQERAELRRQLVEYGPRRTR
jgi:hypothetical protein